MVTNKLVYLKREQIISQLDKWRYYFFGSRDDLVRPKRKSKFTIVSKKYTHKKSQVKGF